MREFFSFIHTNTFYKDFELNSPNWGQDYIPAAMDLELVHTLGLVFDGFSLFNDDRNELGMTSITRNS